MQRTQRPLDLIMIACAVIFGHAASGQAENWPQWRGIKNDGISPEANLPTTWSRDKNLAWRLPLPGPAGSTPIVWNDKIFLTSADKSDLVLMCIRTDGKELWRQ